MPGGDGRGPLGFGPGTGWGAGPCGSPRFRGYFRPRRRGFWGYGYRAAGPYPGEAPGEAPGEKEMLKQEMEILREQLKQVEARLQAVSASEQESE